MNKVSSSDFHIAWYFKYYYTQLVVFGIYEDLIPRSISVDYVPSRKCSICMQLLCVLHWVFQFIFIWLIIPNIM